MIQLFFFMSMIALAALLLNLFWYLEDSRREEAEFDLKRRSTSHSASSCCFLPQAGKNQRQKMRYVSVTSVSKQPLAMDSCRPAFGNQVRFYDIGASEEVPSMQSMMENQSRSA